MADFTAFKVEDAGSYDSLAHQYDRHIRRLGAPLAERICRLAELADGSRVLDVGTGSGLAARRAAQLVAPSGTVLGVDLSSGFIRLASGIGPLANSAPLEFRVMDAEALDLPPKHFDAVISLCAVLHFPSIVDALQEMYRVLKPGGRLVVSFGRVRPIRIWPLMRHYLTKAVEDLWRTAVPRLIAPGDFVRLAARSSQDLPDPTSTKRMVTEWSTRRPAARLRRALHATGFEPVKTSWIGHRVEFESAEEFVEAQLAIATLLRKRLQSLPAEHSAQLRELLLARARRVRDRGGRLVYPYGAVFFATRRPRG